MANDLPDPFPAPGNRPKRPVRRRSWIDWWWAWLLVVLLGFWFAGWGWWSYGGWWWGPRSRTVVVAQVTGPGLVVLVSPNRDAFVGRTFQVAGATVQDKVNDHAYWIEARDSAPMLVIASSVQPDAAIHRGSLVTVVGTVHRPPPVANAKQDWGLTDEGANRVERQGAYVQASTVERTIGMRGGTRSGQ